MPEIAIKPIICRPYFKLRDGHSYKARIARRVASVSYTPLQVAKAYGIPPNLDGGGQTIGIIELGGAWNSTDYSSYMRSLGLSNYPTPIALGTPQGDPGGADVEVMLDSCIIGGIAPKVQQRIYFAPNSDQGFAGAISQAVNDKCDIISVSWGGPEGQWSDSGRQGMDSAMQQANLLGISVYVACGDNGSSDGTPANTVDYPASSPYAIGCGGTNLQLAPSGSVASETVWNDGSQGGATGGGYSAIYSMPDYQRGKVNGSMRGVPDITGVGDPESGWTIMSGGQMMNVGGTSAVAPMWAAIGALRNQGVGKRVGSKTEYYSNPNWFRDTLTGSNGAFNAGPGWDACSGLGSPNGANLFASLNSPPIPTPIPTPTPTPNLGNLQLAAHLQPGYYGLLPLRGPGRYASVHALAKCNPGSYSLTSASINEILGRELPYHLTPNQIDAIINLVNKYGPDAAALVEEILNGFKV
jgi:kumamolisin